jgi:hypothetical protein
VPCNLAIGAGGKLGFTTAAIDVKTLLLPRVRPKYAPLCESL